jgi:hypothetical protein
MAATKKDPAAVALGRKGGKKGGPARAAKLTPEQRSDSARKAVQARWAKAEEHGRHVVVKRTSTMKKAGETRPLINESKTTVVDNSDRAMLALLKRIRASDDPKEIRKLSDQLERVIFHRQFENA